MVRALIAGVGLSCFMVLPVFAADLAPASPAPDPSLQVDYDKIADLIPEEEPIDYEALTDAIIDAQHELDKEAEEEAKEEEENAEYIPPDFTGLDKIITDSVSAALPEPEEVVIPDVMSVSDYVDPGPGGVSFFSAAVSGSVYDGTFSASLLTYFQSFFPKIPWGSHYVCFRGGQYDYYLYFGPGLSYENAVFTGDGLECLYIDTDNDYRSGYQLYYSSGNSLNLSVNDNIVFSDLGYYPSLDNSSSSHLQIILFVLILFGLCSVIRSILGFTLRRGGTS